MLEDTAQGRLLPEGGGASRREGCSPERANLKTEKHLLETLDQEREDTLSCGGTEMYSPPHPGGAQGKTDFCLAKGAWSSHKALHTAQAWGEAPPLKVVLPSISTSEL